MTNFKRNVTISLILLVFPAVFFNITYISKCNSFPIYAQQSYNNPREATGRIVCANCHLAQKSVEIEIPQSVLPNSVFEATVKIPYKNGQQQLLGDGTIGPLNVGAILILPEGFKLAPKNKIPQEIQSKNKGVYIQSYSKAKNNILVVGPIAGDTHQEITFPILAPNPEQNKNTHFVKYPVYVGGNRGRGQIYPSGEKSNNNGITAIVSGQVQNIQIQDSGQTEVIIKENNNNTAAAVIPTGIKTNIKVGDVVEQDQLLTVDPNVGGFGQNEAEIVLQSPKRIQGMITFFFIVTLAQIFFVLKKKQFEKVQALEQNF